MQRRVFISYKRRVDTTSAGDSETLADALHDCLKDAGYAVFIDKTIAPGSLWNTVITKNLAACDGAVALLSEAGLSSEWVQHELSVLSFRRKTGEPAIPFEVVVLDGALLQKLKEPPFNAMGLSAEQLYLPAKNLGVAAAANEFADELSLLQALSSKFAKALRNRKSPTELQLERLEHYVRKFPSAFDRLEALFENPPASSDTEDRVRKLAECLIAATPAQLTKVVQILKSSAEADGPQGPPVNLRNLVDLVFPGWVRAEAAATLALAAAAGKFGALNAQESWTFRQYVRRAEGSPSNDWHTVDLHEGGTELSCVEQLAKLVADKHLGASLRKTLDASKATGQARFAKVADEAVGYKRYFPIVNRVADAEELLALGRPWLRPVLKGAQGDAELGDRGVRLLPLLSNEEELEWQNRYEVLMQQLDANGE